MRWAERRVRLVHHVVSIVIGLLPDLLARCVAEVGAVRTRPRRWAVDLVERQTARAREPAQELGVEAFEESGDGGVWFAQRDQRAVTRRGQLAKWCRVGRGA